MENSVLLSSLFMVNAIFVVSILFNFLVIKGSKKYNFFLDPLSGTKIQSFHKEIVPRAGGISIYLLSLFFTYFVSETMFYTVLAFMPMFIYGLYEDLTGNTPQKMRLLFIMACSYLAVTLTGIKLESIGFIEIPQSLQVAFSVFAVTGIVSALNFIDGLNGLASGISIITLTVIGICSAFSGNYALALSMFIIASSVLGFFVINFPFGKLFLGDTGAYFLGFILALASINVVHSNADTVSPWFRVAVLAYPIIETFFTIARRYKRLKKKGTKFFQAERVHLHSLLYKRITRNNSVASLLILAFFIANAFVAFSVRESDLGSLVLFLVQGTLYFYVYHSIVNFKVGKVYSFFTIKTPAYNKAKEIYHNVQLKEELKAVENSVK